MITAPASLASLFSLAALAFPQNPLRDPTPPVLRPPAAPVLDQFASGTTAGSIILSGRAARSIEVRLSTPLGELTTPVIGQRFMIDVPLQPNSVNAIILTGVGKNDLSSSPTLAAVTQDQEPPQVFINFPVDGQVIETEGPNPTVNVTGQVSDLLSGQSFVVRVNGQIADVTLGSGTDATFSFPLLALTPDGDTVIQAQAFDALFNQATVSIVVTHRTIVNEAHMVLISGDGQSGQVGQELPLPLVIQVFKADGTPFAGKVVTFQVVKGNGLLCETQGGCPGIVAGGGSSFLQVVTDPGGRGGAWFDGGEEAGGGNNLVTASSTDVAGAVTFVASTFPAPAAQIAVDSGDGQSGETVTQATEPLVVFVHDGQNGVAFEPVFFSVVEGGGLVAGQDLAVVNTDVTGHAQVPFTFGPVAGPNIVEATFTSNPTLPARFTLTGFERSLTDPTTFSGIVFDNALQPLQDAAVTIEIQGQQFFGVTDFNGGYRIEDIDVFGAAVLSVDGTAAFASGGPPGNDLPLAVGAFPIIKPIKELVIQGNPNVGSRPVFLPPLKPINQRTYDGTELALTIQTIDPGTGSPVPALDGLVFTVEAGTIVTLDGQQFGGGGLPPIDLTLDLVHGDKIPLPLPNGASPPFAWLLGPAGAEFDTPVRVTIPNAAELDPGAIAKILNFDIAVGKFVIVASAAVSADGSLIVSDPGQGIRKAGFGGFTPPFPVRADVLRNLPGEFCEFSPLEVPSRHSPAGAPTPDLRAQDFSATARRMNGEDLDRGIYHFSGEVFVTAEDLRIEGRGIDFVWARKYRSLNSPATPQGEGWDYSYNIFIESRPQGIRVHDGWSRRDLYRPASPSGPWHKLGLNRELILNGDGTFSLIFADKSVWNFFALTDPTSPGRILSSVDRNGNQLTFTYDPADGSLDFITDTLGRVIDVAYFTAGPFVGLLQSITDFTGRTVTYDYYDVADPDGSFGDLKSATSPAVTGTSNGNDFPSGKTTTYVYSIVPGFEHFLTRITDPKGQPSLEMQYANAPGTFLDKRVIVQRLGDPTDLVTLDYVDLHPESTPLPVIDEPTVQVIVTDRNGNVVHLFYDDCNRVLQRREFTRGLHAGEPAFYDTLYEWNVRSLLTRTFEADGSSIERLYEGDLRRSANVRSKHNLRVLLERNSVASGPPAVPADQSIIRSRVYSYDTTPALPGDPDSQGFNFVVREEDGRGNVTTHSHDADGNRLQTVHRDTSIVEDWTYNAFGQIVDHTLPDNGSGHRRVDQHTYFTVGPATGYLESQIVDLGFDNLTTTFVRNAVGIATQRTDPRANVSDFEINQLDQVMRVTEPDVNGIRYQTAFAYDENDNRVSVTRTNVDDGGAPIGGFPDLVTTYVYDILNFVTRETRQVGIGSDIVREFTYDPNRNLTLERTGVATSGAQPGNVIAFEFDERNLLLRQTRSNVFVTEFDYDFVRNLQRVTKGVGPVQQVTTLTHDGYDRLVEEIDPIGNVTEFHYDENHNLVSTLTNGPDGLGGTARLQEIRYTYDPLDRRVIEDRDFFDTDTGSPIGTGLSTTTTTWTPRSQVATTINPNAHTTTFVYDSVGRLFERTDAAGNILRSLYDGNSNLTSRTEVELSDGGGPTETFVTTYQYDSLDRRIIETNNIGESRSFLYDSHDSRTLDVDRNGVETRRQYDGVRRLVETVRDMDGDGADGDGADIVTRQTFDENSRLLTQDDGNANTTTHVYDELDRRLSTTTADGNVDLVQLYDVHGNPLQVLDPNGSLIVATYDDLDRVLSRTITPGQDINNDIVGYDPNVNGDTTLETYAYDGLSRVRSMADDDTLVTSAYDSLSNLTSETIAIGPLNLPGGPASFTPRTVTSGYDAASNLTTATYPGGRSVENDYDGLERKQVVRDVTAGPLTYASYQFVGPDRIERSDFLNDTLELLTYDGLVNAVGDFGVKRVVETLHQFDTTPGVPGGEIDLDRRTYVWDREQNKTSRSDALVGGPGLEHTYEYDPIYRVIRTLVEDPVPTVLRDEQYTLDLVGNRTLTAGTNVIDPGVYVLDPTVPPADAQVNQYTTTPPDGQRRYDRNGNLLRSREAAADELNVEFDYANRTTTRADTATAQLERYFYDPLGRRVARVLDAAGTPVITLYYYDALGRVAEERDGAEFVQATYLYGHGPDQPVNMQRGGLDFFYHSDDLHNVMALSDAAGAVIERYEYGDYGRPLDPATLASLVGAVSGVGNPLLFSGARHDAESGHYLLSTRYLDPAVGRFTSRDSIGTWADPLGLGNSFTYVGNNPWTLRDPLGTITPSLDYSTLIGGAGDSNSEWETFGIVSNPNSDLAAVAHSTGALTGRRQHRPLQVTKRLDKSSPRLMLATNSGERGSPQPNGLSLTATATRAAIAIPNLIEARKGASESSSKQAPWNRITAGIPHSVSLTWPDVPTEDSFLTRPDVPTENSYMTRPGIPTTHAGQHNDRYWVDRYWVHIGLPDGSLSSRRMILTWPDVPTEDT